MKQMWYFIIGLCVFSCQSRPHIPTLQEVRSRLATYKRALFSEEFDLEDSLDDNEFVSHDVSEKFMTPDPPYPYWFQCVQRVCAPILYAYLVTERYTLLWVRHVLRRNTESMEPDETSIKS